MCLVNFGWFCNVNLYKNWLKDKIFVFIKMVNNWNKMSNFGKKNLLCIVLIFRMIIVLELFLFDIYLYVLCFIFLLSFEDKMIFLDLDLLMYCLRFFNGKVCVLCLF